MDLISLAILLMFVIGIFLYIRLIAHMNACKRLSKKFPGEKIEGCPDCTVLEDGYYETDEIKNSHSEDREI